MFRRTMTALAVSSVLALTAAACGGDDDTEATAPPPTSTATTVAGAEPEPEDGEWAQVVEAAKEEARVVLYTARQPSNAERLIEAFESEYPEIQVEYVRGGSGEMIARADQERAQGADGADVVMVTELLWYEERSKAGEFLPLGPEAEDPAWSEYVFGDWSTVAIDPMVIGVNTSLVEELPTSYEDLVTDPQYRGRLGILDVTVSTSGALFYMHLQEVLGDDFIDALGAAEPNLFPSATPLSQSIGSGENIASVVTPPSALDLVKETGAPVDYVIPDEGYAGFGYGNAALGWSKRPNAARVFADFAMSPEGMAAINGERASVNPIGDSDDSLPMGDLVFLDPRNAEPEEIAAYREEWVGRVRG